MGRRAAISTMPHGMVSHPYASAKDIVAVNTLCELCNITMRTRDFPAHKNSKKHRAAENKENEKNKPAGAAWGGDAGLWGVETGDISNIGTTLGTGNAGGSSDDRACFGCGETGHTKRECPSGGGQACYGCGEVGHQKRDCPQGGGGQGCFNCGNVGHRKTECPEPLKPRAGGPGRACFNCGQEGHNSRDCTEPRVMRCRNCDAEGHMSKECPEPTDWSRVKCNNCHQYGHTVKRCPDPPAGVETGGSWENNDGGATAATGGWSGSGVVTESAGAWADGDAGAGTDWADDVNASFETGGGINNNGW